jgi:HSP20 family molecular chaperone IbpA
MYMSNRINNAINLIGTEIINTLQDISKPIIENIDVNTKEKLQKSKIKYYYNETPDFIYICIELPAVSKQNCSIEICGGYLNINAKTNYQTVDNQTMLDDFKFLKNKSIEEKIDLNSNNIDENQIDTSFINGLLKIKLKKKPKTNININ